MFSRKTPWAFCRNHGGCCCCCCCCCCNKGHQRNMTLPNVSLQICAELYFLSKSSNHWPLISNSFYKGWEEISGDMVDFSLETGGVSIILNLRRKTVICWIEVGVFLMIMNRLRKTKKMQPTGLLKEHPSIPFNPLSSSLSEGQGVNLHDAVIFLFFATQKNWRNRRLPFASHHRLGRFRSKTGQNWGVAVATRQLGMKSCRIQSEFQLISSITAFFLDCASRCPKFLAKWHCNYI